MSTEVEAVQEGKELAGYPLAPGQLVYHWSPADRHASILQHGLRIRSKSVHAPIRYPMICLSPNSLHAWSASGGTFDLPDVEAWDLWAVYVEDLRHGFEVLPFDDMTIREIRVYRSIPADCVTYVGTRVTPPDPS